MEELSKQKCVPCEGGEEPMQRTEAEEMLQKYPELEGWSIFQTQVKGKIALALKKQFKFKPAMKGADFVHALWQKAEEQGHHPDIELKYGRVNVIWTTHAIAGLSMNDFIMAAATEEVYEKFSNP